MNNIFWKMEFKYFLDDMYKFKDLSAKNMKKYINNRQLESIFRKHLYDLIYRIQNESNMPLYPMNYDITQHKIYSVDIMIKGHNIKKYGENTVLRSDDLILCLCMIYTNTYIPAAYFCSLLHALLYDCLPLDAFLEEFTMSDFSNLKTAELINSIQHRYATTKNRKYLCILILIIRGRSTVYKEFYRKINTLIYRKYIPINRLTYNINPLMKKAYSYIAKNVPLSYANIIYISYTGFDIPTIHNTIIRRGMTNFETELMYIIHIAKILEII